MQHSNKNNRTKRVVRLKGFTLVEALIAMALIGTLFVLVMQSFGSMLLGSYLIEARTSVRNEGEFVGEYFKLRVKNADPQSLICNNDSDLKPVTWQTKGSSDIQTFFYDAPNQRLCIDNASNEAKDCDTVLTYNDVLIHDVVVSCEQNSDPVTGQQYSSVGLIYELDSAWMFGNAPAVEDVSRFVSVAIR